MDERNQLILFSQYGNNFSITTAILLFIALILLFYIYDRKKIDNFSILVLLASIFSIFLIGLIDRYNFGTDRYNYLEHMPVFREGFFLNGIKDLFLFRSSNNTTLIYSFIPLPTPKTLLDFGLFVKCIYLCLILFLISKDFEKKKTIIYFLIFFPLFHFYSSFGGKECLVILVAYFWSESLINKKIITNFIFGFLFVLIKFEFGFLIVLSSIVYFILQIKIFRNYTLFLIIFSFYLGSFYLFDQYIDFINYKFRGFHTVEAWISISNFNDFLFRLIKYYFNSPFKIMNFQNLNFFNASFSITIILAYIYFYIEIFKIKKITLEIIFIVLFKVIFCAIYSLMIENWGTYQRLLFTPLIISIFLSMNYSTYLKNNKNEK